MDLTPWNHWKDGSMFSRSATVSRIGLALLMLLVWSSWSQAADPKTPAKPADPEAKPTGTPDKKPEPTARSKADWAGLRTLLEAGEYAKAVVAADQIVKLVRPLPKDPEFVLRSIDTIDALMRRGFAELQSGQLDAADATFTEAEAIFADRDIKRAFSSAPRHLAAEIEEVQNNLDLRAIELANVRGVVILERLRRARIAGSRDADTAAWGEALASLEGVKTTVRDQLKKRLEKKAEDEATLLASPHKRALVSGFHRELIAGIVAFEMSQFPGAQDPMGAIAKSLASLNAARTELDHVIAITLPKGIASGSPEKRAEVTVLLFELAVARCEALLRAGDMERARLELDEVFKLHKDLAGLRKLADADSHPDLFRPVMMSAEITLADSRKLLAQNEIDEGFAVAAKALETLARAEALPLATDNPLRRLIPPLVAAIAQHRARLTAAIDASDAADAAGSRLNRALDRTAPAAIGL
jgi:tetratricopeptide (TPR) repeat protein